MGLALIEMSDIEYCDDPYSCADSADALVIVTEWEQFRVLDLDRLEREMACPVVVDLRNIYNPEDLTNDGFLIEVLDEPRNPKPSLRRRGFGHPPVKMVSSWQD